MYNNNNKYNCNNNSIKKYKCSNNNSKIKLYKMMMIMTVKMKVQKIIKLEDIILCMLGLNIIMKIIILI